jgi:hypothetical protein
MPMTGEPSLKPLDRWVGSWTTEATHPSVPGLVVQGTALVEWLEGERFLIHRARNDHPDFPNSIAIIGFIEQDRVDETQRAQPAIAEKAQLTMQYFDSRGVFRVYEVSNDDEASRFSRVAPGFSQRFTGTFADGGTTIVGHWQLCEDDVHWKDDLQITYRRAK